MTTDIETGCSSANAIALSNRLVREENVRLREMLKRAEDVAGRYTIMLREGDHRIKNSLQIVSSLMHLQAGREDTLSARQALETAAARIQSIARMHDALQATEGEDSVNLGAIIQQMCGSLHEMAGDPWGVTVEVDAPVIMAPVAIVQPVVLTINELVVNALRHAFPDGRKGTIQVSLRNSDGQLSIVVADNGVGLPAGYSEGRGYGMKLVRMMTDKLGGTLRTDTEAGTRVTIIAPASDEPRDDFQPVPISGDAERPFRQSARISGPKHSRLNFWARKPWNAEGRG